MAKVQAIVRGPESFFNGVLNPPGSIVEVDEEFVSDKDYVERDVQIRLKEPIIQDGKAVRTVTETQRVKVRFRPLGTNVAMPSTVRGTPHAATATPDRLNVNDFLKGGVDEIEDAIVTGKMDDFLDVIAQTEKTGKGRKTVAEAITDRRAAIA